MRARSVATLAALSALLLAAALAAPATARVSKIKPSDEAATHAYLQAEYTLAAGLVADRTAVVGAAQARADQLAGECPGALSGAPQEGLGFGPRGFPTPREEGEMSLHSRQLAILKREIETSVAVASYQPDRTPLAAYARTVTALRWSDPRVAVAVAGRVKRAEEELSASAPAACADILAWTRSGYHKLSDASKTFAEAKTSTEVGARVSPPRLLIARYEGPAEHALLRRLRALIPALLKRLRLVDAALLRLNKALGVKEERFDPLEGATPVAHIRAASGATISVGVEPASQRSGGCALEVSIDVTVHERNGSSGSGGPRCLKGRGASGPSVGCSGSTITIDAPVLPRTRRVRLRLSNGSTITSHVVSIPARLGGPAGLYVQAVKGPSPYPVALSELDAHGRVLRSERLRSPRGCREAEPGFASGPTFTPLVHGRTPGGIPFTIEAVQVHVDRRHTFFDVQLQVEQSSGPFEGGSSRSGRIELTTGRLSAQRRAQIATFNPSLQAECPPHEYAIVYGVLKAPGESVLARTATGLVPLTRVSIPARLHAHGALVFGVFATVPAELIVQNGTGATLFRESLAKKASEEHEYCEGAAEP